MIPWLKLAEKANDRCHYISNLKHREFLGPSNNQAYLKLMHQLVKYHRIFQYCTNRFINKQN